VAETASLKRDIDGGALNPRDLKLRLARELAARFHGAAAAEIAIAGWNAGRAWRR
jgi:tyrosyl-tRNA synthetase